MYIHIYIGYGVSCLCFEGGDAEVIVEQKRLHRDAMKQEIVSYNDVGFKDNSLQTIMPHHIHVLCTSHLVLACHHLYKWQVA